MPGGRPTASSRKPAPRRAWTIPTSARCSRRACSRARGGPGERAAREAVALDPNDAETHLTLAEVLERRGVWRLAHRPTEALPALEQGAEAARRAVALSPGFARAHAVLASLLELQARRAPDPRRREALVAEARDHLRRALDRAPLQAREFAALGRTLGLP